MASQPDLLTETPEIQELEAPVGELHLRFFLPSDSEFALGATGITEVMQQATDRITPIPNASSLLLGTINLRGQVIWVADLAKLLGDSTPYQLEAEIPVIAIEDQDTILGLAIAQLGEMEWLDPQQLQSPTEISQELAPYIQGEWSLAEKPLRLLDHRAILRSEQWSR
ncbi:MAG: chemotaxis protein CheW [Cyanophyceae cyanobacterium]